jgi:hypothetical protein
VLEPFLRDLLEGKGAPTAKGLRFRVAQFGQRYSIAQGRPVKNVQIVCEILGEGETVLVECLRQTVSEGNALTVLQLERCFNISLGK